jgi:OmcA/MtrC family decaheme c-type cytochrome
MTRRTRRAICSALLAAAMVTVTHREATGQEVPLDWEATKYFKYNVENVVVDTAKFPWLVTVIFSVTDPTTGTPWDIKTAMPFTFKCGPSPLPPCPTPAPSASLTIDIGWNTTEYVNTGSRLDLIPIFVNPTNNRGVGAAFPIRINALTSAAQPCFSVADCPGVANVTTRFRVSATLPTDMIGFVQTGAAGTGVVAMEGHPVWPVAAPTENVPVKSVFKPFPITDAAAVPRRQIVDFNTKCSKCHDNQLHKGTFIPRLALHGGSRNEEPGMCVICHNPNQTDIPFRTLASPPSTDPLGNGVAPEVSIDFKRMAHEIHAGGFRRSAFKVVGFNGTITDFSGVRFPAELRNCLMCHIDVNGKGTFELPLASTVLGSTVKTGSTIGYVRPSDGQVGNLVDLDPTNNLRITPTASVCSACHDRSEVRRHMQSNGAVFGALQSTITPNPERCVSCHGPGKDKDVRKVHEVSGGKGGRTDD